MSISKESYEQNYQQFRSLNQIMWQIPVLAMTLTGGLWFGVSKIADDPMLVTILLLTSLVGNLILSAVLLRFRHVMGCYLKWLKEADPSGYVDASVNSDDDSRIERFCKQDKTVRTLFSFMLWWAAACSFIILLGYWNEQLGVIKLGSNDASIKFYDEHAAALADGYESISFEKAYPYLADRIVSANETLEVLDIGAGSGRDAAWIAERGHSVLAVEPSTSMLAIARGLHSQSEIVWINDKLPNLKAPELEGRAFDIILINAVWMHLAADDRSQALHRIKSMLKPGGSVFATLRLGPFSDDRGMFEISSPEFVLDAESAGFTIAPRGDFKDLLGRPEVSWKAFELSH